MTCPFPFLLFFSYTFDVTRNCSTRNPWKNPLRFSRVKFKVHNKSWECTNKATKLCTKHELGISSLWNKEQATWNTQNVLIKALCKQTRLSAPSSHIKHEIPYTIHTRISELSLECISNYSAPMDLVRKEKMSVSIFELKIGWINEAQRTSDWW